MCVCVPLRLDSRLVAEMKFRSFRCRFAGLVTAPFNSNLFHRYLELNTVFLVDRTKSSDHHEEFQSRGVSLVSKVEIIFFTIR